MNTIFLVLKAGILIGLSSYLLSFLTRLSILALMLIKIIEFDAPPRRLWAWSIISILFAALSGFAYGGFYLIQNRGSL